ncbi:MAG: hypothetical protein R3F30_00390 [Planctomycetota bacterium]
MSDPRTGGVLRAAILLGLTAAPAAAQSLVLPAGAGVPKPLATTEGDSDLHVPGYYSPSRVVVVYRGADLGVPSGGLKVASVGLRRDGLKTTAFKAHRTRLSLRMSSDGVALPSICGDASFAALHGRDRVELVSGVDVDWKALARPAQPPASFDPVVKLGQPFVLLKGRNLCLDLEVAAPSGNRETNYWYVDAQAKDRSSTQGSARSYGKGCPDGVALGGLPQPLDGESPLVIESRSGLAATSQCLFWLGVRKDAIGTLKLPLDLGPLGAPGCRVYVAPVDVRLLPTTKDGEARLTLPPPPPVAGLAGQTFYVQAFTRDVAANALGWRASPYLSWTLGQLDTPLPARLAYHSGPVLSDVPTAARDAGLVVELR